MEHAYFAPSAASRWIPCPMSLFLTNQSPKKDDSPSIYAHEGTVCHDIAAKCLTQNKAAADYTGQTVDGVAMTQELIDGIQMYIDEVRGLAKEYKATGGKIEHKVILTEDCWGTADSLLWNADTLLIVDLKMGKGVIVPAENNEQLKLYSVGGIKWLKETHNILPKNIVNIIIQPRTVNPIRRWEILQEVLMKWFYADVVPILKTYRPGMAVKTECNPGEIQCRWCPISATCAAQSNKMVDDAQKAFSPFTEAEAPAPALKTEGTLEIKEVVGYKSFFPQIQRWMKTIDDFLKEQALLGNAIPGYKLVEGRSNRKWKADESQIVTFLKRVKVEPYKKSLITPPQAEKVLGKKPALKCGLDKLITKPPGQPNLVLQSDTRPEIELNVETKFEEFVETGPVVVDDTPDDTLKGMSVRERMYLATLDEEEVEVETKAEKLVETATGGTPVCIISVKSTKPSTPPDIKTKRHQVLSCGKGGETLSAVALVLGCTINMIKMHLRYLHERDGYSYEIYSNETFKVY